MYASLSRFTTKYRAIIIAVWFVAAAVLFVFAPKLSNVGVSDESQFLPQDTESSTASRLLKEKFTSAEQASGGNGVLIIYDSNGLSAADLQATQKIHDWLISAAAPAEIQGVTSIYESEILKSTLISSDQTTMMMNINFSVGALSDTAKKAVADIRDYIHRNYPNEHIYLTGQIGLFQDLMSSVAQTISRTTIVTIVLVSILLLIIYRSPVAMLLPLLAIGISYLVSSGIIGFLGQAGAKFSTLTEAYLIVIIFGVGTDYCLFIVSRFREELGHKDWGEAQSTTIRQIAPVIAASALTVIVAFLSMGISRFGMNQTTGYGLAIGVAITLLAGLTLVPALMAFFGKHLFWPVKVVGVKHDGGFGWKTIGEWVGKRPLLVVIPITIILFLPFIALPNLKTSVDIINQLPQSSESVKGYKIMVGHFPVGELSPCYVLIEKKGGNISDNDSLPAIARLAQNLQSVNGVSRVDYYSAPAAQISGMAQQIKTLGDAIGTGSGLDQLNSLQTVGQSLQTLVLRYPGMAQSTNFQQTIAGITQVPVIAGQISTASLADIPALIGQLQKTIYGVSDSLTGLAAEFNLQGNTPLTSYLYTTYFSSDKTIARINVVFSGDPDASTTLAAVARVRSAVSDGLKSSSLAGNSYYVGGESAVRADMMLINESDFGRVVGVSVAGILIVIAILLRSLIAPLYMMLTVLLNYGCTLGVTTWIFIDVMKQNSLIYLIPLFIFVILVALGADYNIFLVSRIREESQIKPIKEAVSSAVANTGGVITACGIILAGTFATLLTSPLQIVVQIGAAICAGVLMDTFLVRALLVPAIARLIGRWNWWPSALSKKMIK